MKKLTKTILSVAAVSALTAAMAASASAMTATYAEGEVNKVMLADVKSSGASQTMIILNEDAETVTETMVEAIDQKDDNGVFTEVPVNALEDGTYYVRIGGTDGSLQEAEFTVGGTEVETETIIVGDATLDNLITMDDATAVATKAVEIPAAGNENVGIVKNVVSGVDKETIIIGDATLDDLITMDDATAIATKAVEIPAAGNENVGINVTVVK